MLYKNHISRRNATVVGVVLFGLGLTASVSNAQTTTVVEVPTIELNVEAYEIEGFNPLSQGQTNKILKKYIGSFTDLSIIYDAASALEKAIHNKGYSLISVVLPEQPVTNSVIKLRTEGFTIASVEAKNNKNFSATNIRRGAPTLIEEESPNLRTLQRSLALVNLHPAKRVAVNFLSKDKDDTFVNATLTVTDKYPKQYFAWLNDTGNDRTGEHRLGLGFQHSNLFDKDHIATVTYTTSPQNPSDVTQIGLNYRIPVYKYGGIIDFLAFDSDIDTGTVAEVFEVSGRGKTYKAGYTQLFHKRNSYSHQGFISIEDKLFDNEVTFEDTELVPDVRSRPISVGYQSNFKIKSAKVKNGISYHRNLSGGSFNSDEDYAASRSGADSDWQVLRYFATLEIPIKKLRFVTNVRAQHSSEPLITGEQFGIGGNSSVRGFEERELIGDSGYLASLQIWFPPKKGFSFNGFYDTGKISRESPLLGEIDNDSISSAGVGLRWTSKDSRWNLRVDIAHVLQSGDPLGSARTEDGDNRAHFNLLYRR